MERNGTERGGQVWITERNAFRCFCNDLHHCKIWYTDHNFLVPKAFNMYQHVPTEFLSRSTNAFCPAPTLLIHVCNGSYRNLAWCHLRKQIRVHHTVKSQRIKVLLHRKRFLYFIFVLFFIFWSRLFFAVKMEQEWAFGCWFSLYFLFYEKTQFQFFQVAFLCKLSPLLRLTQPIQKGKSAKITFKEPFSYKPLELSKAQFPSSQTMPPHVFVLLEARLNSAGENDKFSSSSIKKIPWKVNKRSNKLYLFPIFCEQWFSVWIAHFMYDLVNFFAVYLPDRSQCYVVSMQGHKLFPWEINYFPISIWKWSLHTEISFAHLQYSLKVRNWEKTWTRDGQFSSLVMKIDHPLFTFFPARVPFVSYCDVSKIHIVFAVCGSSNKNTRCQKRDFTSKSILHLYLFCCYSQSKVYYGGSIFILYRP